jgi:hypothetical protein
MRQVFEHQKAEQEFKAQERAQKSAQPKGAWKETLNKAYKAEDATVLSSAIEAAMAEKFGDVAQMKQEFDFYKPHIDRMGMDREFQKGHDFMVAQGVPASVAATLKPEVEAMVASGMRAPAEVMYQAAYAEHALKQNKALATKTLEARTQKKPVAPLPKNTTGPVNPKYVLGTSKTDATASAEDKWSDFMKQFEQYK